jgi:YYY domain-containing protein
VAVIGGLAVALFLPFHLSFRPPVVSDAGGVLPLGLVTRRSQLSQFLQFWGAQLLLLAPAILLAVGALPQLRGALGGSLRRARAPAIVAWEAPGWEAALVLAAGALAVLLAERIGSGVLVLCLLVAAGAGWAAWGALDPTASGPAGGKRPLAFAFGAICLGALLLATCEVVHIRDFYGGALRRMNTVFKFYYQAWLLFAVGGSVASFWLLRHLWARRREPGGRLGLGAFGTVCLLLFGATLLYPWRVTHLRTEGFKNEATLDGMAWMSRHHPEDRAAAEWLRENAATPETRAPVVLEATGGPYSEFARMATQTGLPTVLGWDQHERLWRGAAINAEVEARARDVETIYTAAGMEAARPLLDKYDVAYIVVGYLERQKYSAGPGLAKFDGPAGGLEVAFRQGQTTVYRVTG